ncbi:MAG: hypothetical protein AAGK21_11575 [Bacteroidota bacterium]
MDHDLDDPVLAELSRTVPVPRLEPSGDVFHDLAGCLLEQQHPMRSTKGTYRRLLGHAGLDRLTPAEADRFSEVALPTIRLSGRKLDAFAGVADWFRENAPDWQGMTDTGARKTLRALPGVGAWTADVILLWTLGREDILPVDDYHFKKAMAARYGIAEGAGQTRAMREIAEGWRPHRSLGVRTLLAWREWQREIAR